MLKIGSIYSMISNKIHKVIFKGIFIQQVRRSFTDAGFRIDESAILSYDNKEYVAIVDLDTKAALFTDIWALSAPYFEWVEFEDLFL